jgi:hypothetical protein
MFCPRCKQLKNLLAGFACACTLFSGPAKETALKSHPDDLPHNQHPVEQMRLVEIANVTSASTVGLAGFRFGPGTLTLDSTSPHRLTWREPESTQQFSDYRYGIVPILTRPKDLESQVALPSTGLTDPATTLYWSPGQAVAPSTGLAMPTDVSSGSNTAKG